MAAVVVWVDVAVVVVVGVVVSVVVVAVVVGEVVGVVTSQSPAYGKPRGFSMNAALMRFMFKAKAMHSASVFTNLKYDSLEHSSDAANESAGPANSVTVASKAFAVSTQSSGWYAPSTRLPKMLLALPPGLPQPMVPSNATGHRFMIRCSMCVCAPQNSVNSRMYPKFSPDCQSQTHSIVSWTVVVAVEVSVVVVVAVVDVVGEVVVVGVVVVSVVVGDVVVVGVVVVSVVVGDVVGVVTSQPPNCEPNPPRW